jgi:AcrR family transcriptional regulator
VERKLTPRGAATRRRIVEAAAVLIRQHGAADTHLDDIRRATTTSKSQLFHYFPGGRSDLLRAVARHEADQVLAVQQPQLSRLSSWDSWMDWREVILRHHERYGQHCALGSLTAYLGQISPQVRAVIAELYENWERMLADGVRALQIEGVTDSGIKPERAAKSILTAIQGGTTMMQLTNADEYLELCLDAALLQLRAVPPSPAPTATRHSTS